MFFSLNISRHFKSKDGVEAFTRIEETVLASIEEDEIKGQVQKELAPGRAITQHIIASVVGFVISFMLAFYLFQWPSLVMHSTRPVTLRIVAAPGKQS